MKKKKTGKKLKITLVSPEVHPFSKTGGLGDVAGSLPKALARLDARVTVITPFYGNTRTGDTHALGEAPVVVDGREKRVEFLEGTLPESDVQTIFIRSPEDFERPGIYGENGRDYPDNPVRFALFAQAAILAAHRWCEPEILHIHDWTTSLIPVYLRTGNRMGGLLAGVPIVLTIHNLGYQGVCDPSWIPRLGIDPSLFHWQGMEFWGKVNFLKGGILFSDLITTVSPSYAEEIQQEEFGFGLDGLLRAHKERLLGILNGVDYTEWDPETDPHLKRTYNPSRLIGRNTNRQELRKIFGLENSRETPIAAAVSRLNHQKGTDILLDSVDALVEQGAQLVILGTGDPDLEARAKALAERLPGKVGVKIGFDVPLSHKILGAADIFLAPSRYEPCGLAHLYGMRYGVVPLGRATGGLRDTIVDWEEGTGERPANGFLFRDPTPEAFQEAFRRAMAVFRSKKKKGKKTLWAGLRARCMTEDWSWDRSARDYMKAFQALREGRIPRVDLKPGEDLPWEILPPGKEEGPQAEASAHP